MVGKTRRLPDLVHDPLEGSYSSSGVLRCFESSAALGEKLTVNLACAVVLFPTQMTAQACGT